MAIITILQADKDSNHVAQDLGVLVPGDSIDVKNIREYGSKIPLNLKAMESLNGGSKDYEVQIAAYAEEAKHIAQTMAALRDGLESLTGKIRKQVNNVFGTLEQQNQAATDAARFVVEKIEKELTRAKATNPNLDIYQQSSIIRQTMMAASNQALTNALSTKTIEKIQQETVKETNVVPTLKNPFSASKPSDLLADYDKFAYSKDPAERQYLQQIEEQIYNANVHYYHQNQLTFKKAIIAAATDYDGHINDAIKYINNLNRGNKPDDGIIQGGDRDKVRKYHEQFGKVKANMSLLEGCDPKSVLQYHRQAYEFEWVSYLQGAVHRASAVGGDAEDIIGRALGDVRMRHNARLRNFNRYDIALKPQTMSEEEDRLMDDVQLAGPPPRVESLKTRRKRLEEEIKKKEEEESKFDPKELVKKSQRELADDAGDAVKKLSLEARDFIFSYIDGIDDKVLRKELKAKAYDLIKEETQRRYDFFKLQFQKQDKWQSYYQQLKDADKRFWRGFWRDWFFIYLQAELKAGNAFADKLTDNVMKLLMGALK